MKKKILAIAAAAALAAMLGLTACGGGQASSSASASSKASTSASASASASSASKASTSASASASAKADTAVYWTGKIDDYTINYMDDGVGMEGAIFVVKDDLTDGKYFAGPIEVTEDGTHITIVDEETKEAVTFTVADVTEDSMKLDFFPYGVAEMTPVMASEFKDLEKEVKLIAKAASGNKKAAQKLKEQVENATIYWEGTLPDGSYVGYMGDQESTDAGLSITKADFSAAETWAGVATPNDNGSITIKDTETGKTVTCSFSDIVPETSMTIDIEGYGKAALTPVTGADLESLLGEVAQMAQQQ